VEEDECWFSRFAQPNLHAWACGGEGLRLVERDPGQKEKQKAIACYGALDQDSKQTFLYLCDSQPNSDHTISMLKRLLEVGRSKHKSVVVIIWDRASWHKMSDL
jgi:hypothetical protein